MDKTSPYLTALRRVRENPSLNEADFSFKININKSFVLFEFKKFYEDLEEFVRLINSPKTKFIERFKIGDYVVSQKVEYNPFFDVSKSLQKNRDSKIKIKIEELELDLFFMIRGRGLSLFVTIDNIEIFALQKIITMLSLLLIVISDSSVLKPFFITIRLNRYSLDESNIQKGEDLLDSGLSFGQVEFRSSRLEITKNNFILHEGTFK